jgi:hypothetical protein
VVTQFCARVSVYVRSCVVGCVRVYVYVCMHMPACACVLLRVLCYCLFVCGVFVCVCGYLNVTERETERERERERREKREEACARERARESAWHTVCSSKRRAAQGAFRAECRCR